MCPCRRASGQPRVLAVNAGPCVCVPALGGPGERSEAPPNTTPPSALQRMRRASKTQGDGGTRAGRAGSLPSCSPVPLVMALLPLCVLSGSPRSRSPFLSPPALPSHLGSSLSPSSSVTLVSQTPPDLPVVGTEWSSAQCLGMGPWPRQLAGQPFLPQIPQVWLPLPAVPLRATVWDGEEVTGRGAGAWKTRTWLLGLCELRASETFSCLYPFSALSIDGRRPSFPGQGEPWSSFQEGC